MTKKHLRLPSKITPRTRVSFYEKDQLLLLTDQRRGLRIVLWAVAVFLVATVIGGILWVRHLSTLPNQHRLTDQVTLAISLVFLSVLGLMIWPAILAAKDWHRSFRVHVDVLRRTCVCTQRTFGIRARKREIDTSDAQWDAESTYVQHHQVAATSDWSVAKIIFGLILFLLGPIGWIIGVFSALGRNASESRKWEGQAMVRLCLSECGETIALITIPDEMVAQEFLLAWDRQFAKPTRSFK